MRAAVLDLAGVPAADLPELVPAAGRDASLPLDSDPERVWAQRWLIGHHARFLFEVCAATALTDGARHLRHGCADQAVVCIRDATVFVRAFPAAVAT